MLLTSSLLAGCPADEKGDTDGTGTTSEHGSTSDASTSTGTSGGDGTSTGGDEPTSTGTDGGSSGGTSGGSTGGEGSLCEQLCVHMEACNPSMPAGCMEDCLAGVEATAYIGEGCLALHEAALTCVPAASCESLAEPTDPCQDEQAAQISPACVLPACEALCAKQVECGVGSPDDAVYCGAECSFGIGQALVENGSECAKATEAMLACHAALTCEQLEQGVTCEAEVAAQEKACAG